ncbi:HD-GYP domain-containing protein [Neobacillus dielmonensis]|uniref:HD-GYP domain-containing protein n=1 Tax=Neobacillus dielmonensis TaxID=1347369 RepID=UPI000942D190|nr:HD domain-containing phosphohydrolase [Neobacillus dielmonensis]
MLDLVLYHHERYDGKGYPKGLKGEEIPLAARIMSIADSFDAMTSKPGISECN